MASTSTFGLSEFEYDMVRHIVDIGVLEELKLSECSIYKVPFNLRKVNEEAYTPQLISIGPIHLGKDQLKPMQETKQRYFHFFWERLPNEQVMKNYKQYLESKEQDIRQCYAENFADHITQEKLVDMILLDDVFIMELLLRNSVWKSHRSELEHEHVATNSVRMEYRNDCIMAQPWLGIEIARDLILLENQIPLFVLNELYETVVPDDAKKEEHTCFVDLALEYLAFYDTQGSSSSETKMVLSAKKLSEGNKDTWMPKHFTDLVRFFYLPTRQLGQCGCPDRSLRTATKLQEAGVNFEKVLKRRLLNITFDNTRILSSFICLSCIPVNCFKARFRVPQLKIDLKTECVLRNLIAFEQCHYPEEQYICNYVSLIDSLIHTQVDVALLVEDEVIVHRLGSDEEVATLVNGLCKHVVTNTTCYSEIINELNKYYDNVWNTTMASLWLVYFKDLWRESSTLVGIVIVVFAIFGFLRAMRYLV